MNSDEKAKKVATGARLFVVTSYDHRYTFAGIRKLLRVRGIAMEIWSYERMLAATRLPWGAYIFTDFDRLLPWHLEIAGRLYGVLQASGAPVFNDPRRFLPRAALLRTLHEHGINDFNCRLPAFGERPDRFPVFLRTLAGHRGTLTDLLPDAAAAAAALDQARNDGYPISDLAFIELGCSAESDGTYKKHACFCVGDALIRAVTVSDTTWHAKYGTTGTATETFYRAEYEEMARYPHAALMRRVFAIAGTDFGRIDFGMRDGRPQIFELNSNPHMVFQLPHPSATRTKTVELVRSRLLDAFAAIAIDALGAPRAAWIDARDALPRRRTARHRLAGAFRGLTASTGAQP